MSTGELEIERVWICGTAGTGLLGKLIRNLDRTRDAVGVMRPSAINHVFWQFDFSDDEADKFIFESNGRHGTRLAPLMYLHRAVAQGRVFRVIREEVRLTDLAKRDLWENCIRLHGRRYDWRQIGLYWAWLRLGRREWAERAVEWGRSDWFTCNEFVCTTGTGGTRQELHAGVVPDLEGAGPTWTPEVVMRRFLGRGTFGLKRAET